MEGVALGDYSAASSGPSDVPFSSGGSSAPAAAAVDEWWMSYHVMFSISFVFFLLIVVSIAANSLILILFCASRSLRKPQNLFTFNLAVSDLLAALLTGVPTVSVFRTPQPEVDPVLCVIIAVVLTSSCTCAICSIANIAFVRYISIVRTSLQERLCRWSIVIPFCIGGWILNFSILYPLIASDRMRAVRKPVTKQCTLDFTYNRTYNEVNDSCATVQRRNSCKKSNVLCMRRRQNG